MTAINDKPFDIVLYGATSFVGQLTAKYLANFISDKPIKVAIAGRNQQKLSDIQQQIGSNLDSILANSDDFDSLVAMVKQTKVIISTVGPYSKYGENLVKACVHHGVDYVDLCGEMTFVKAMMDKYQQQAQQTGARIVNTCGFDSLPSDLGVYHLQQLSYKAHNKPCQNVSLKVKSAKGGMSGGTLASIKVVMDMANQDDDIKRQVIDPYILIDTDNKPNTRQVVHTQAHYDDFYQMWQTPFIMDPTNSRVVHRSNFLLDNYYGDAFKYEELMWFRHSLTGKIMAKSIAWVLKAFDKAVANPTWNKLLDNYLLPKPGTGPSVKSQENGYFNYQFYGYENDEARQQNQPLVVTKVTGQKDPGYAGTAMMLSQAGLCLAFDIDKQEVKGGFWSPAFCMGDKLIKRLENHAMMTFEVVE